jgi:hypothetical protein
VTSRSTAQIERALSKKGFRRRDTHHKYYGLTVADQPTLVETRISHGIAEYGDALLAQVAKQLHLSKLELLDLIDCRLDEVGYVALLREKGILSS